MKRFFKVTSILCLMFCSMFIFSACGINPSHYLDNYGVCNQCGDDFSVTISRNANLEYVSAETVCSTDDYKYFKFVANGETSVTILIEEITATIDKSNCLWFYTKSVSNLTLSHVSGANSWTYNNSLTQGETYYLKVKVKTTGTIKITVSPNE